MSASAERAFESNSPVDGKNEAATMENTKLAFAPAVTSEQAEFVLRPTDMSRAFLLVPDEGVEKPREFLDRVAQESSSEPPNVSLRSVLRHMIAAWRGEAPERNASI
jgi:hypothetical protein